MARPPSRGYSGWHHHSGLLWPLLSNAGECPGLTVTKPDSCSPVPGTTWLITSLVSWHWASPVPTLPLGFSPKRETANCLCLHHSCCCYHGVGRKATFTHEVRLGQLSSLSGSMDKGRGPCWWCHGAGNKVVLSRMPLILQPRRPSTEVPWEPLKPTWTSLAISGQGLAALPPSLGLHFILHQTKG